MLASAELVAFVPVSDLGRARDFYENLLGIPCVDATGFACVFDSHGTTLRATLVEGHRPAIRSCGSGIPTATSSA